MQIVLGLEAHFELWKKFFCLVPRHQGGGSIFEVGGTEVWHIAGSGYPVGTPKKGSAEWSSEWFYIDDVPLPDHVQRGLPEFSSALIRPFYIMLLYQYLLHYGLLLHIMSQYLCLLSLILQGLKKEGECRQLGFWARKGANIRDLFCTTPKVLKLRESHFWI